MKVMYCCQTGQHASVVAAGVHLGILPADRRAGSQELAHWLTSHVRPSGADVPMYMGVDERNHQVYSLGIGSQKHLITRIVESFAGLYGIPPEEFKLVDVERSQEPWLAMVAHLTGRMGAAGIHRMLTIHLLQRDYSYIVDQVKRTRGSLP